MKKALIIVDIQNDFLPGGALAVPQGDEVIPLINRLQEHFDTVVLTQDWHPPDHGSFASNHAGKEPGDVTLLDGIDQILWPDHCVQGTRGAEFAPELRTDRAKTIIQKGTNPLIDSYSTFFDNEHRQETGLHDWLRTRDIREIYIAGLATDYCVLYSVLDARKLGYEVHVIEDACRGIDLKKGDIDRALEQMQAACASIATSDEVMRLAHAKGNA